MIKVSYKERMLILQTIIAAQTKRAPENSQLHRDYLY